MKLLDKIALNSLIKTITSFILAIIKIFAPHSKDITDPKPKRPIRDLLDKWLKK